MLFVLFQLDGHHYALDALDVVKILPLVAAKQTPHSPGGSVGIFNYRGRPVLLIDLSEIVLGRATHARLNTRIILVERKEAGRETHLVGLLAEQVTELMRSEEAPFALTDATDVEAPYLRSVFVGKNGFVQHIDANALVSYRLGQAHSGAAV